MRNPGQLIVGAESLRLAGTRLRHCLDRIRNVNVILLSGALKLPAPERIELAEALWASVQRDTDTFPVSQAHVAILKERLREMEANPEDESAWEEVRDRLQNLD